MRYLALCLLLLSCLASGCASKFHGSYSGPVEDVVAEAIAEDAAAYLAGEYPPGLTELEVLPAGKPQVFDLAFENKLRSHGFTVRPDSPAAPDGLSLSYILDHLEEAGSWYLQLRLSDGAAIARAYSAQGQPEAGRTATPHEFRRPFLKNGMSERRGRGPSSRSEAEEPGPTARIENSPHSEEPERRIADDFSRLH